MKRCSVLSWCALLLLALFASAFLANADTRRPLPIVADGGLQMSVNTSAYRVYAGDPKASQNTPRVARKGLVGVKLRDVLVASINLANRSPQDLTFTFADEAAAQRRFDFRVFNSQGVEIWAGVGATESAATSQPASSVLRKRSKWSSVVQVPLKIEDVWLTPGVYTLEASLAGEPKIGATTLFEVALPPTPEPNPEVPKNTGIRGQVLRGHDTYIKLDGGAIAPTALPFGTKASVSVQQILPEGASTSAFTWQGETDALGNFEVNTPVGRFRVQVRTEPRLVSDVVLAFPTLPGPSIATREVSVKAGAYTPLEIVLGGGVRFEQPHPDTGINGQVFAPTETNELVVRPGAIVEIEEIVPLPPRKGVYPINPPDGIVPDGVVFGRGPFRWKGTADAQGRFRVNTPPGRFRVVAQWTPPAATADAITDQLNGAPLQIVLPLRASAEVQVADGQFSDVRLDLKAGLVEIGTRPVASVSMVVITPLQTLVAPALIQVTAQGMVNSGGWSQPQLQQRGVTQDGFIEFDFVAKPPSEAATQAFVAISATTQVPEPANFRGVRVFAAANSNAALIVPPINNTEPPIQ